MKDGKQYMAKVSMMIADVVIVKESGGAEVLTGKVKKDWDDISYFLGGDDSDDDDDDDEKDKENVDTKKKDKQGKADALEGWTEGDSSRNKLKQARLRDQQRELNGEQTEEQKREEHQQKIREKKWAEKRKQATGGSKAASEEQNTDPTQLVAYKSANQYPPNATRTQIIVDTDKEAVLLPINGIPVPFHINTIKNVSKSEEGRHTYLRINFYCPGMGLGRDVAPAMAAMVQNQPHAWFIKELNFRSMSSHAIGTQFRMIKELQKRVHARLAEQQERADVVEQAALVLTKDKKVPKLQDLSMKPQLSGRKSQGMLQAHKNGLRFSAMNGERKDLLYSNIKHAIFQPCENELIVCIHFHLKNFIMIGKKKHKDITFYTEVLEASQNLDGRNRSMYDPDELDEEQRERALKKRLNQMFKDFSGKVEKVAEREGYTVQFDVPYRELGFNGCPHKEMVLLQPSVHCLMNLTESPTFVISLDDIEHVHLERVMFSAKNFDMTIIFKDFEKLPKSINAIAMHDLEGIKEWLDDIELTYTSGSTNMNWKAIMKVVKAEDRFYFDTDEDGEQKDVGWDFLKVQCTPAVHLAVHLLMRAFTRCCLCAARWTAAAAAVTVAKRATRVTSLMRWSLTPPTTMKVQCMHLTTRSNMLVCECLCGNACVC
jgi:nucleosome binding factor SPN SPT16 subunit